MTLTVGSLFSGIGGLDLGLERAGMRVIWQSEIDPYACRVLARHWPRVPNLGDVTAIDWGTVERPDVICGGYPCQPFSFAGARRGEDDPRHLWPHFARALRELRPRVALLENVPGHLSLGFGDVLADLAAIGYDAEWECIPAAAVGAPHLRWRIFCIARHVDADRDGESEQSVDALSRSRLMVSDAESIGKRAGLRAGGAQGIRWRRPTDGGSAGNPWAVEPGMGRVANGIPARVDRLRTLGNAVVPQVAEWIGRQIVEAAT